MRDSLPYLARAALLPVGLLLAGLGVVWGPWSPLALDRANAAYLAGDAAGARSAYEAVVDGWHFPSTRAEAALRAGILATRSGDARAGAEWLKRAIDLEPDDVRRAGVRNQLAALYADALDDPASAAEQYNRASIEAGDPRLSLAAGTWWERAGDVGRAYAAYRAAAARLGAIDDAALALARDGMTRTAGAAGGVVDSE
jgi:hypothetical protein